MSLAAEYNDWHQRVFDGAPENPDEESPWYKLVTEYLHAVVAAFPGFSLRVARACLVPTFPAPRCRSLAENRMARDPSCTRLSNWRKPMLKTCLTRRTPLTRSSPAKRSNICRIPARRFGKWPALPARVAHFSRSEERRV